MTALHHSPAAREARHASAPADQRAAAAPGGRQSLRERARAIAPGFALALAVAAVATVIGEHVPLVGSAVPGAVIGAVIAITVKPGARVAPGLKWASTFVLQCSVVLLGAQLSIGEAARVGVSSLPVMLGTLAVCLGAAWLYGRLLGVPRDLRTLIGVGTGICGGSAIAAVSPVIEAASTDVAYAISTIFLFNIAAVLAFPLLGHALGMSQQSFGLFAGTAVNDTSSVVATATTYGAAATSHAVVVKLVRTLMIIPICLGLAALTARRRPAPAAPEPRRHRTARSASTCPRPAGPPARLLRLVPVVPHRLRPGRRDQLRRDHPAAAQPAPAHVGLPGRGRAVRDRPVHQRRPPSARQAPGRCCSAPCSGSPSPPPASASSSSRHPVPSHLPQDELVPGKAANRPQRRDPRQPDLAPRSSCGKLKR